MFLVLLLDISANKEIIIENSVRVGSCPSTLQETALMYHLPLTRIRIKNGTLYTHCSNQNQQQRVNWAPFQTARCPTEKRMLNLGEGQKCFNNNFEGKLTKVMQNYS